MAIYQIYINKKKEKFLILINVLLYIGLRPRAWILNKGAMNFTIFV